MKKSSGRGRAERRCTNNESFDDDSVGLKSLVLELVRWHVGQPYVDKSVGLYRKRGDI